MLSPALRDILYCCTRRFFSRPLVLDIDPASLSLTPTLHGTGFSFIEGHSSHLLQLSATIATMDAPRIPPVTANARQACYQCFKEGVLQKCSGCRRVSYCGAACQKANWSTHKGMCKALKAVETKQALNLLGSFSIMTSFYDSGKVGDSATVNLSVEGYAQVMMRSLAAELRRPLRVDERNLVGWEPRCLECGRSEVLLRLEASRTNQQPGTLRPCPDCKLAFSCSEAHWNTVKDKHQNTAAQDARGLPQCAMNKLCFQDAIFGDFMAGAGQGPFTWAPERTKTEWHSVKGLGWDDFAADLKEKMPGTPEDVLEPMLRAASEGLSMPMTILLGLECLNEGDEWTRKDMLSIHVLGAAEKEVFNAQVFEEILHRLPQVNAIKLTFVGPELVDFGGPQPRTMEMDTCPQCSRQRRKRTQIHHPKTYHDFVQSQGSQFEKPDLAVAFDSGASQEEEDSWRKTIDLLIKEKIPTIFTAFNEEEARGQARIFQAAEASLHQELTPKANPWGSLLAKIEPNKVLGFYAVNGWLSGGFR
ncbi:unnamed protein product [Cyclocybe aegerita]|uniref:MYND-type domain-containing protein n=1 Tax=Cyclocybe aegerita TaxID=1973307 RepID=A0A8S0WBJ9_CYCAE|nr:unnamed protein product [Cyclocybe aegerita]